MESSPIWSLRPSSIEQGPISISTESKEAQTFFDQGLRLAWGFYFPEAILSYQTASHYDPEHPMP